MLLTILRLLKIGRCTLAFTLALQSYTAVATSNETKSGQAPRALQDDFIQYDITTQRFTASINGRSFDWVIENLEKVTGIEFTVFEDNYASVTTQFENQPLEKAIRRLFHDASYMISNGDVIKIFVLSRGDSSIANIDAAPDISDDVSRHHTENYSTHRLVPNTAIASMQAEPDSNRLPGSIGETPGLDELRAQLEQLPELKLSEEKNGPRLDSAESDIANIILNNLLQNGMSHTGQKSVNTDESITVGE